MKISYLRAYISFDTVYSPFLAQFLGSVIVYFGDSVSAHHGTSVDGSPTQDVADRYGVPTYPNLSVMGQ